MQRLALRSRKLIDFPFPFVELAERRKVAIQRRHATAVFENRSGEEICIAPAKAGKLVGRCAAGRRVELLEKRTCPLVVRDVSIHGSESKNFLRIIKASVSHLAHKGQNDLNIHRIDVM